MDLQLYARVLWRFRVVVIVGFVLAVGLSFMSYYKVSPSGISHRQAEVWRSDATLIVTQDGFPWGRLGILGGDLSAAGSEEQPPDSPRFASPDRLVDLAVLYSYLAQSDEVRRIMEREAPVDGQIMAEPVASDDGDGLPLVGVSAMSNSANGAVRLAQRQIDAFSKYIGQQQTRTGTPREDRVVIEEVDAPASAALEVPRKKTEPIAIFLAAMIVTLGAAFVLENLRPRIRPLPASESIAVPPHVVAAAAKRKRTG